MKVWKIKHNYPGWIFGLEYLPACVVDDVPATLYINLFYWTVAIGTKVDING